MPEQYKPYRVTDAQSSLFWLIILILGEEMIGKNQY
jgi:hypothetical protein